jgi:hypothetical protein
MNSTADLTTLTTPVITIIITIILIMAGVIIKSMWDSKFIKKPGWASSVLGWIELQARAGFARNPRSQESEVRSQESEYFLSAHPAIN